MVTAEFLKLNVVYEAIWKCYFKNNFVLVVNGCSLNLTGICPRVVKDVAEKIPLEDLLRIRDRPDKFVSNIFKIKVDSILQEIELYKCTGCKRILTQRQAELVSCIGASELLAGEITHEGKPVAAYASRNGEWFTQH